MQKYHQLTNSLAVVHYVETREITLINCDDGYEFLLEDYEEAKRVADLIYEIIGLPVGENELSPDDFMDCQEESVRKQNEIN